MRILLTEGATGAFPFLVDRTKPFVSESRPSGISITKIPGRFSICDCVNGNRRRYGKRVWEKNLTPGSQLMESISKNAAFGLLEHPKDGIVTLLSPISHLVTEAKMVETRDASGKPVYEVVGEISLVGTPEGDKLKALIEAGYNPLVSSRGYGSLQKASDGVDDVMEDYVCESWDVVIKPSFEQAELAPVREPIAPATTARMAAPYQPESAPAKAAEVVLTEATPAAKTTLKESPSSGAGSPAAIPTNKKTTMELNEIKGAVTALRGLDPSKLDPQRFAESLAQVESLHQNVAEYGAADPKRSYEAHRLHSDLDQVAKTFSEAAQAPRRQVAKLTESTTKLMKVINAVTGTALTYKKRLGEALQAQVKSKKMTEELTRRGQGWREIAEDRKGKLGVVTKQFDTACEALDIMAKRYHEDTTELGRRLLQLEFKEKLTGNEPVAKKLKEATRLRQIASIREELEGKKPAVVEGEGTKMSGAAKPAEGEAPSKEGINDKKQKGAPSPGEGSVASEPGKVTNENKEKTPAAKVTESQEPKYSFGKRGDPRDLNESVEMVRRWSGAAAK